MQPKLLPVCGKWQDPLGGGGEQNVLEKPKHCFKGAWQKEAAEVDPDGRLRCRVTLGVLRMRFAVSALVRSCGDAGFAASSVT